MEASELSTSSERDLGSSSDHMARINLNTSKKKLMNVMRNNTSVTESSDIQCDVQYCKLRQFQKIQPFVTSLIITNKLTQHNPYTYTFIFRQFWRSLLENRNQLSSSEKSDLLRFSIEFLEYVNSDQHSQSMSKQLISIALTLNCLQFLYQSSLLFQDTKCLEKIIPILLNVVLQVQTSQGLTLKQKPQSASQPQRKNGTNLTVITDESQDLNDVVNNGKTNNNSVNSFDDILDDFRLLLSLVIHHPKICQLSSMWNEISKVTVKIIKNEIIASKANVKQCRDFTFLLTPWLRCCKFDQTSDTFFDKINDIFIDMVKNHFNKTQNDTDIKEKQVDGQETVNDAGVTRLVILDEIIHEMVNFDVTILIQHIISIDSTNKQGKMKKNLNLTNWDINSNSNGDLSKKEIHNYLVQRYLIDYCQNFLSNVNVNNIDNINIVSNQHTTFLNKKAFEHLVYYLHNECEQSQLLISKPRGKDQGLHLNHSKQSLCFHNLLLYMTELAICVCDNDIHLPTSKSKSKSNSKSKALTGLMGSTIATTNSNVYKLHSNDIRMMFDIVAFGLCNSHQSYKSIQNSPKIKLNCKSQLQFNIYSQVLNNLTTIYRGIVSSSMSRKNNTSNEVEQILFELNHFMNQLENINQYYLVKSRLQIDENSKFKDEQVKNNDSINISGGGNYKASVAPTPISYVLNRRRSSNEDLKKKNEILRERIISQSDTFGYDWFQFCKNIYHLTWQMEQYLSKRDRNKYLKSTIIYIMIIGLIYIFTGVLSEFISEIGVEKVNLNSPPLPDIVHDYLSYYIFNKDPHTDSNSDYFGYTCFADINFSFFGNKLCLPNSTKIWQEFTNYTLFAVLVFYYVLVLNFANYGTIFEMTSKYYKSVVILSILRCITMSVTILASPLSECNDVDSYQNCHDCKPFDVKSLSSIFEYISTGKVRTFHCNDLMFSGHTFSSLLPMMQILLYFCRQGSVLRDKDCYVLSKWYNNYYHGKNKRYFKVLCLWFVIILLVLAAMVTIIASAVGKTHYTVDVVISIFFTLFVVQIFAK